MNITAVTIGCSVAASLIYLFKLQSLRKEILIYTLLLSTFPVYYWSFALYAHNYNTLLLEITAGLAFLLIASLYLKFTHAKFLYLLTAGYLLHSAYDVFHDYLFINSGTPNWWPEFCGSIDFIIGIYLVFYVARKPESVTR